MQTPSSQHICHADQPSSPRPFVPIGLHNQPLRKWAAAAIPDSTSPTTIETAEH